MDPLVMLVDSHHQGTKINLIKKSQPYDYNESQIEGIKKEYHKDNWSLISWRKIQWRTKSISDIATYKILLWNNPIS